MELVDDTGHVESRFDPFGGGASVGAFGDSANLDSR